MTNSTTDQTTVPDFFAYDVIKKEGEKDEWVSIGAAWRHKDGKGFNLRLDSLPEHHKVILRAYIKPDPMEEG